MIKTFIKASVLIIYYFFSQNKRKRTYVDTQVHDLHFNTAESRHCLKLKVWKCTVLKWISCQTVVIGRFRTMAGATVWIKCIGTIASQINRTFTFSQITVIPHQMFRTSHWHDLGNRDWCDWDWVSGQVLSLSSFGFLVIQGHFSILILVLDIVRLVIADTHFLHFLGTLQSSFLLRWRSSTERRR